MADLGGPSCVPPLRRVLLAVESECILLFAPFPPPQKLPGVFDRPLADYAWGKCTERRAQKYGHGQRTDRPENVVYRMRPSQPALLSRPPASANHTPPLCVCCCASHPSSTHAPPVRRVPARLRAASAPSCASSTLRATSQRQSCGMLRGPRGCAPPLQTGCPPRLSRSFAPTLPSALSRLGFVRFV